MECPPAAAATAAAAASPSSQQHHQQHPAHQQHERHQQPCPAENAVGAPTAAPASAPAPAASAPGAADAPDASRSWPSDAASIPTLAPSDHGAAADADACDAAYFCGLLAADVLAPACRVAGGPLDGVTAGTAWMYSGGPALAGMHVRRC